MLRELIVGASFIAFAATPASADMRAIVIDPDALSFDLSPSNYNNSETNYSNSSNNYSNSSTNYDNSPTNYENSPSNYENSPSGHRRLITDDGHIIGYYVPGKSVILNIYSMKGRRVGYVPAGGHTEGIFNDAGWCGVLGVVSGEMVVGLSKACFYSFLLD